MCNTMAELEPPPLNVDRDLRSVVQGLLAGEPVDRDGQLTAIMALEEDTFRSSENHSSLLKAGVSQAVVAVMRAHPNDSEVQVAACRAIQHLAASTTSGAPEGLCEAGACKAIVDSIGAHRSDATVQQAACHALEILAFASASSRKTVFEDGGADAMVLVLKEFRNNAHVQQAALAALQAIIEAGSLCQERVAEIGGLAAIISAIADHKGERSIQYWGRLLLQGVCAGNAQLRMEAMRKLHWQGIELEIPSS